MRENTSTRLKQIMKEQNLKQIDILNKSLPFQKKLGVKMGKSALSQYVSGKSNPDQHKLVLLAKTLGVSEPWLMGFEVEKKKSSLLSLINETSSQLTPPRQQKVYDFAKHELEEQQEQNKAVIPIEKEEKNSDEIYTLAAHSDDPDKTYTDKEISEIEAFSDQVKADYDKKHNK
ncbi:Helix-turn-helix [Enterococcus hirae]|uniref:helix-turn-helix domain-containing protein n=1 Tax=Enterococcus hirae TaxID=1354 RepID=UPI001956A8A2|nr:helix-turn-helix domain-containing protein [Enterococcus hirae]VTX53085.1 Helix-turn-helix [Enterococcus hirae]